MRTEVPIDSATESSPEAEPSDSVGEPDRGSGATRFSASSPHVFLSPDSSDHLDRMLVEHTVHESQSPGAARGAATERRGVGASSCQLEDRGVALHPGTWCQGGLHRVHPLHEEVSDDFLVELGGRPIVAIVATLEQ